MMTQNSVRLQYLDLAKERYLVQEKRLFKYMRWRMWGVIILQFLPALLCLDYAIDLTYIMIIQSATMISLLSWTTREYFLGAISFISTMY